MSAQFDSIIVGAGQAGPSLAGRLTKSGRRIAFVERHLFGGTCVNTGCIPTKTLVANNNNRLRDFAPISASGSSQLAFFGNATSATTETIGALTLTANQPEQIILRSGTSTGTLAVAVPVITAPAGVMVNLIGENSAIGSATNQLLVTPPSAASANNPIITNGLWTAAANGIAVAYMTTLTASGITNDFVTASAPGSANHFLYYVL